MSQDQSYLLKACLVVQSGQKNADPDSLTFLNIASPGALNHGRWLTRANRVLRLYMATDKPSTQLLQLVTFIVQVYATSWFLINASRQLTESIMREALQRVLIRNRYFAHSENVLLSALTDPSIDIRRDAARKRTMARKEDNPSGGIRKVSKSSVVLHFDASDYYNMIDWNLSTVTPPPLVESMSNDELLSFVEIGPIPVPELPCHTQAVERSVKEVSCVSGKVSGHEARHGMIVAATESRKRLKRADDKHSYLSHE